MKLLKLTILGAMAVMAASCCNAPQETKPEVKVVQPGEQAPLADPGQKNFGNVLNDLIAIIYLSILKKEGQKFFF